MATRDMLNYFVVCALLCSFLCRGHVAGKRALLVVDVQYCFLPDGDLPVPQGHQVIPVINELKHGGNFDLVVFTQDWHPPGHVSFSTAHRPSGLDVVELNYTVEGNLCHHEDLYPGQTASCSSPEDVGYTVQQRLWPDHCVIGSPASRLHEDLEFDEEKDILVKKGTDPHIDSYSSFYDVGRFQQTDLDYILKSRGVSHVYVVGLALDYCVLWSALDAQSLGYDVYVVLSATAAVSEVGKKTAISQLHSAGVHIIDHHTALMDSEQEL